MTIVGDFTTIVGDENKRVGDAQGLHRELKFKTGAPMTTGKGYITFMVKGMTTATGSAQVELNGTHIGQLFNNNGGNSDRWHTQMVSYHQSDLNNPDNVLRLYTVGNTAAVGGQKDDYFVRNVICHFHQNA